ncbi:MAG: FAD-dependent oxidoreductase [Pseudomonadota bacterium]
MPPPIKLPAFVAEIFDHALDLRTFVLRPEGQVPRFRPGQFLHLAIDPFDPTKHWPDSRVFSIASSPTDRSRIRITVSRVGKFTSRMFEELKTNSRVWVKMPYGTFCPTLTSDSTVVLLAGGTGITPFVSFVEWAAQNQLKGKIHIHYAARSPELLIYREFLESYVSQHDSSSLFLYAEEKETQDNEVLFGRISTKQVWSALPNPGNAKFFVSGPKEMIDSYRSELLSYGANSKVVFTDQWGE